MRRTRIKFCGLTRSEDIDCAVKLGVDAIGLILVPESPRALGLDRAAILRRHIPPLVSAVLLFRNASEGSVRSASERLRPDLLQFHGDEDAAFCERFGRPYLRAVGMAAGSAALAQTLAEHPNAAGFILDGHAPGAMGGTGESFDWTAASGPRDRPWLLAGGLSPDNVAFALRAARPYAVDVASGIECAPGIKDLPKMRAFIDEVRSFDHANHAV